MVDGSSQAAGSRLGGLVPEVWRFSAHACTGIAAGRKARDRDVPYRAGCELVGWDPDA